MKRWKQWIRLAVIAAASFVLLVTVLPQVASGIGLGPLAHRLASSAGCSSGGTGSTCGPEGTVLGTVTISGSPVGFHPAYEGAGACPDSGPAGMICANPLYALADGTGHYRLSLPVGKWRVAGFYVINQFGGTFLGSPKVLSVSADQNIVDYAAVAYQKPAAIKGTITVTGVPAGIPIDQLFVVLCPSYAHFTGGLPLSIACATAYTNDSGSSGSYSASGLPPGAWTAYPSFCPVYGGASGECVSNAKAGKPVTLVGGSTSKVDLTTPFIVPGYGLLSGKVTVSGTPSGFSDPVAVVACQKNEQNCQTDEISNGKSFELLLGEGTWSVNGLYLAPPFYNAIVGPTETVTVASGRTTTLDVTAPYKVLGQAAGTVTVTGAPAGVAIQSYTVLACPDSSPLAGALALGLCVNEYSGPAGEGIGVVVGTSALSKLAHPRSVRASQAGTPVNSYELSTLTPGTWTLYPGYQTEFGSATDPVGTKVTVTAAKTTYEDLSVPYQVPTVGAVAGTVDVIGASGFDYEAGVQACSTAPTAKTCTDEQDAYTESEGTYQMTLTPGTWWVSGFADNFDAYGGPGLDQTNTPAVKITVTAGAQFTENFTVNAAS